MKLTNKFWWVGLLLVFSLPALADTVDYQTIAAAAQKTNDLSRQAHWLLHPHTTTATHG